MNLEALISVARGESLPDLVPVNAKIINTLTGEIEEGNVAIHQKHIAGIGDYHQGQILGSLALPIAGLLSQEPISVVVRKPEALESLASSLGCALTSPFATLSFLALPVIPEPKLTDLRMVDMLKFRLLG